MQRKFKANIRQPNNMIINQIQYKDKMIDISVTKNQISWSMEHNGERFGNSVILTDKKIDTIIGTISTIVINAIESYEGLLTKSVKEIKPNEN